MARNVIGPRKVKKLREKTGLPVLTALTRGGTGHRIDLCLDNGSVTHLYKDGTMEKSDMRWSIDGWKVNRLKEETNGKTKGIEKQGKGSRNG